MATLFGWVNTLTAFTVLGNINVGSKLVWYLLVILLWVFLMVWDTLLLDVSWWSIRFRDFKVNYAKACLQYGEYNAWHERPDWDNAPLPMIKTNPLRIKLVKPPLICGIYWWWWLFSGILAGLGIIILSVIF
jgi:hypothetical protein